MEDWWAGAVVIIIWFTGAAVLYVIVGGTDFKNVRKLFDSSPQPGQNHARRQTTTTQIPQFDFSMFNDWSIQPTSLVHGTSRKSAMDIYRKNRWLVDIGDAVWLTTKFETAKLYAGSDGAIVQVQVSPTVALSNHGDGVYIAPVEKAKRGKYYRVHGVTPICVLDTDGQQIAP